MRHLLAQRKLSPSNLDEWAKANYFGWCLPRANPHRVVIRFSRIPLLPLPPSPPSKKARHFGENPDVGSDGKIFKRVRRKVFLQARLGEVHTHCGSDRSWGPEAFVWAQSGAMNSRQTLESRDAQTSQHVRRLCSETQSHHRDPASRARKGAAACRSGRQNPNRKRPVENRGLREISRACPAGPRQTRYDVLNEKQPIMTKLALRIGKLAGEGIPAPSAAVWGALKSIPSRFFCRDHLWCGRVVAATFLRLLGAARFGWVLRALSIQPPPIDCIEQWQNTYGNTLFNSIY